MPQYAVTRTGGGLPTSDYAIGLEQAFHTAESMRNQRRRNQQAANIMKQTMAAKGLSGTVDVTDEGEINAQADEASLKRFFGKDKLDDTDTTDNAMLSYIEQRNDFKQKPTFEQTIDHGNPEGLMQKVMDANQGTTDQIKQIYDKQLEVMGQGVGPNGNASANNASIVKNLMGGSSTASNGTPLLSAMNSATSPSLAAVANSSVPSFTPPTADPNAPIKSPMQLLQERMGTSAPSDIDSIKAMMESSGVTNDSLPDNIKQGLNDKVLAMKDLDNQIALEQKKGSGIINPDGSVDSPINDEAMKRIAGMQAQKKALNEDKDLMSQIAAMAQQQGQPTPQAPDPAKAQAVIQSIVNPLGLTATPQANPTLNPLLTQSGAAGTPSGGTAAAASGGTATGTTSTGGNTSKKVSSATSEKQSYEASVDGNTGIKSIETSPTVITRSTDGADYQDTMPYSMGTLLAQQGYRDAISAGAGDAVGMQMNPFNAMLKEKIASIGNRNAAAALANKQNVDVKQGTTKIEAGTGKASIREGYSSYSNVSMGNSTTKNGGGSQQPEDNDITVGTVVMKKNKDGTITSTDSNISGSEEDVASNAYNNWSKLSEIDKAVIRMNGTDKSSLKNALNKVVGKDIYEKTKSSISGKPVRKVEITIEGNKYQVALNSEGGLVPISGQKLPPHFDQKGHGAMGDYFGMLGDKLRSTPDKLKQLEISYMTDDDEMVGSYSPMSNNAKTSGTFPESFSKAIRRSVQLNQTNKSK